MSMRVAFPASTAYLAALRSMTRAWMRGSRLEPGDWELVLTELVTNAINHAEGDAPVEVDFSRSDGRVHLTVSNEGAPPPEEDRPAAGSEGPGGRGLMIVRALTSGLTIGQEAGRVVVSCWAPEAFSEDRFGETPGFAEAAERRASG